MNFWTQKLEALRNYPLFLEPWFRKTTQLFIQESQVQNVNESEACCHTSVIPELGRQRQEDLKF
jgi:hypothetical protein